MPSSPRKPVGALVPGLYERLVTRALKAELDALTATGTAVAHTQSVDPAEAHATLARHIESVVARALRGLPAKARDKETHQAEIATASSPSSLATPT